MMKKLAYLLVFLIGSLSLPEQAMACEEHHPPIQAQPTSCERQSSSDCCQHKHAAEQKDAGTSKCASEHCLGLCHSTISLFFQWNYTSIPKKFNLFTQGNAVYFYPIYQQPNGNIWTPPQVN